MVMKMKPFSACIVLFLIGTVFFRECRASSCVGSNCESCISSSYSCSWCTQKDFKGSRCDLKEKLLESGCQEGLIDNPQGSTRTLKNYTVKDSTGANSRAIQIQPQRVTIKTRPRQQHSIPMTFRAANDFPVDLYFLFDNSVSMNRTIHSLGKLADDIGQAIGDISRNYKMGYGVFQDKVILPFADTSPQRLINPCIGDKRNGPKCIPPFEFRHLLSMTSNIMEFKSYVHNTKVSGNVDHPEGSIDALLQSVKCISNLGWRDDSRKLLIFASNGPFKTAGAGKLAGIVIPNDGSCHLNQKGEYDWQLKQDYPSISQLVDAVNTHEVHIIFAVDVEQRDLFTKLVERVPHSVIEMLDSSAASDNQKIQVVIDKKYKEMISAVEIIHNNVTGVDIQIKALSDECQTTGTNKCKGLKIGSKINFQVDVRVTECPEKPEDRKKQVILHPDFLKKETLVLDIEIICDCDCKNDSTKWEVDSDVCTNGNGTLKCGICDCNDDRYGEFCQCDSTELDSRSSNCIQPNSNSTVCSGSGTCKCGVCLCDEGYSGPYCECNDRACGTYDRELCGGARGRCVCGECQCEDDYEGRACECPKSNATCIQNGEMCSGAGSCHCGKCECDKKYTGRFCQNCFLCGEDPCDVESYRACAQCALIDTDSEGCDSLGCPPVELVTSLGGSVCSIKQADGCFLQFVTEATVSNVTLFVQRTKTCTQPVDAVPIIAGVIGGVVAVGIFLLFLWKVLTSLFDKIEYSKFQEEVKTCKWAQQDNPFYKGATTTYKNPMLDTSQPLD